MQLSAFPSVNSELDFDDVVPKATSTRRVAAAAFYHCLGADAVTFPTSEAVNSRSSSCYERLAGRPPGRYVRCTEDKGEVTLTLECSGYGIAVHGFLLDLCFRELQFRSLLHVSI